MIVDISQTEMHGVLKHNPEAQALAKEVQQQVGDRTVALGRVMSLMARRAASRMNELLDSENEHVALKASADVLDRTPETSKTLRHQVTSLTLDSRDAKELAAALVEGARVREAFAEEAQRDIVRVEQEVSADPAA
jgi:hypothetical protein